jgi:hypothetical protein
MSPLRPFLLLACLLAASVVNAQGTISFRGLSLRPGDSCTVTVQRSTLDYIQKKLVAGSDSTVTATFPNLPNGRWAVRVDATGYYYPSTRVVDLNGGAVSVELRFTRITLDNATDYYYEWSDDSSHAGHAQQSYINDPPKYRVLSDTVRVPDDFSSVNLLNQHGILLSDGGKPWSREDAFRLYQTVRMIPGLSIANLELLTTVNSIVKSVWTLVDGSLTDDIQVSTAGGVRTVRVSREAFTYATPLVAELDGVKGRFFSKRLYQAVVNFATDYGRDAGAVASLAQQGFGIRFLDPGPELQTLMGENAGNFQSLSPFEKITILSMFAELPEGMHAQANLKYIVRRIAGQVNPVYPNAAAIAWTGKGVIEFMQSAFVGSNYGAIQRLVLHEKAHFLWAGLFSQQLKDDWADIGGWFRDPTAASGWATSNTTEFVSAYAHANNPDEDMAETIATYVTNPDLLRSRSIRKFEFIRDRVMHGTRYISMIRQNMTFRVYNLYPDYNYPGKILGVKVNVTGAPDADKLVTIELRLHAIDSARDGASSAYTRIFSPIGTFYDMGLSPVGGNPFLLRGQVSISRLAKSGYWTVNQIMVTDAVGNNRFENNSTFGLKIFINNPGEDLVVPRYIDRTLQLSSGIGRFSAFSTGEDPNGANYQFVQGKYDVREKNQLTYIGLNFAYPTDIPNVNKELQFGVMGNDPRYLYRDSIDPDITHVTYRYPIPEYFPSGWYKVTQIYMKDQAQNDARATFMIDTTGYQVRSNETKHLRDSILITTQYADHLPPQLDMNAITIRANPTNPVAPDGETLFEMEFFAKDSSGYPGKEAGLMNGYYVLRDPQGKQFHMSMQQDLAKQFKTDFYYRLDDPEGTPGTWRKYKVSTLLPRGSAPGLWGVEAIGLIDRANNMKHFNFVETVRFDIEETDSSNTLFPRVEILGKKVNALNVDSVALSIACVGAKGRIYRARFYSSMGGNSIVTEGVMASDSVVLQNIPLSGVRDGILYATVFLLDTSRTLLGIGKASYTKDVVIPRSAILRTNLSDFGRSNIDSLVLAMRLPETNGGYAVVLRQLTIAQVGQALPDSVVLRGSSRDTSVSLSGLSLRNFRDGLIQIRVTFLDSVGNPSEVSTLVVTKDVVAPLQASLRTNLAGYGARNLDSLSLSMRLSESKGRYAIVMRQLTLAQPGPMPTDSLVLSGSVKDTALSFDALSLRGFRDGLVRIRAIFYDSVGNPAEQSTLDVTRDIVAPLPTLLRTNLRGFGIRNLDSMSLSMRHAESRGQYTLVLRQQTLSTPGPLPSDSLRLSGVVRDTAVTLSGISLRNFRDGLVQLRLIFTDSVGNHSEVSTVSVTRDIVPPAMAMLRTNHAGIGKSLLDSLSLGMRLPEGNGSYRSVIGQFSVTTPGPPNNDSLVLAGSSRDTSVTLSGISLRNFHDGLLRIRVVFSDSVGNAGPATAIDVYKDTRDPSLQLSKLSTSGRKAFFALTADEYIRNIPVAASFQVRNGTVRSVLRRSGASFELEIDRACHDSLTLQLRAGEVFDTVGNPGSSVSIMTVDPIVPPAATIRQEPSGLLSSGVSSGNQWYFEGAALPGASSAELRPLQLGRYTVKVTVEGCAGPESKPFLVYAKTSAYDLGGGQYVNAFPNPVVSRLKVYYRVDGQNTLTGRLHDMTGRLLWESKALTSGAEIDMGRLSKGLYRLILTDSQGRMVRSLTLHRQ